MILRVIAICVGAAMICAALRLQHPEMATALSLAAGLGAMYRQHFQTVPFHKFER